MLLSEFKMPKYQQNQTECREHKLCTVRGKY